jgi:2-phosphosulfolactate phosphatase
MQAVHGQAGYRLRFDWGLDGADAVAADAEITVVVDVLSFTTTVTVALDAGMSVYPYRWNDGTAEQYARHRRAVLAVGRSKALAGQISLSPATLRLSEPPARLVLPSPNGATIAHHLGEHGSPCLAVSLRNAAAVARWITAWPAAATGTVAVLAAGERWPDGGLRPAVEDLWGAGAVIAHLSDHGWSSSPEAAAARAAYEAVRGRERAALLACASGRELVEKGYEADVTIAAEMDASGVVPVLEDTRFTDASQSD